MFHSCNGLFFGRTQEGVRIVKTSDEMSIRKDNIAMDMTLTLEAFASIVAAMCAFGETTDTYKEALKFLNRPYPGDSVAHEKFGLRCPLCSCSHRGIGASHETDCPTNVYIHSLRAAWPNAPTGYESERIGHGG